MLTSVVKRNIWFESRNPYSVATGARFRGSQAASRPICGSLPVVLAVAFVRVVGRSPASTMGCQGNDSNDGDDGTDRLCDVDAIQTFLTVLTAVTPTGAPRQ